MYSFSTETNILNRHVVVFCYPFHLLFLLCFLIAESVFLSASFFVALSFLFLPLYGSVWQQLAALRPMHFLWHAVFSFLMFAVPFLKLFPQRCWMLFSGRSNLGFIVTLILNSSSVSIWCLLVGFTPSPCLPFNPSVCFLWKCAMCPALLCTVSFFMMASLRTRLIAGAELYIQVNSWDS